MTQDSPAGETKEEAPPTKHHVPVPRRRYLPFRIWGAWVVAITAAVIGTLGQRRVVVVTNDNERLQRELALAHVASENLERRVRSMSDDLSTAQAKIDALANQTRAVTNSTNPQSSTIVPSEASPPVQSQLGRSSSTPSSGPWSQASGPFLITVRACEHQTISVRCDLMLENRGDSQELLTINPRAYVGSKTSLLVDAEGNRYWANPSVNSPATLLPGVPLRAALLFDNVPPTLNQGTIVLAVENGALGLGTDFSLTFRGVTFTSERTNN